MYVYFTSVSSDTSTSTLTSVLNVNASPHLWQLAGESLALSRCCGCSQRTSGSAGRNLRGSQKVPRRGSISQSALRRQIRFLIARQRRVKEALVLTVSEQEERRGHRLCSTSHLNDDMWSWSLKALGLVWDSGEERFTQSCLSSDWEDLSFLRLVETG